jgi:hypothetical protein
VLAQSVPARTHARILHKLEIPNQTYS